MSVRWSLLKFSAKMIIAIFMTLAGGILVGAVLLKALLLHHDPNIVPEPDETSFIRE